jgi:hypothetical protein
MKAFLEHDRSGLLYQQGGGWVRSPEQALAFGSAAEAEAFSAAQKLDAAHAITRETQLNLPRWSRPPGAYQVGE